VSSASERAEFAFTSENCDGESPGQRPLFRRGEPSVVLKSVGRISHNPSGVSSPPPTQLVGRAEARSFDRREPHEVVRRQRTAQLLHARAGHQATEVDREEAGGVEQLDHGGLRLGIVA
jgi:hypothetical protein